MDKVPVKTKIIDTLLLSIVVVISALLRESIILRWLMEVGFALSLGELSLAAYIQRDKFRATAFGILSPKSYFILMITGVIAVASLDVFLFVPSPSKFILFFGAVISADAGGLLFGEAFGKRHPWFSRKLSPNKTWAGYIGEYLTCWTACMVISAYFRIELTATDGWFVAFAPLFAASGDLCASGAKRQLHIKDSGEFFRRVPIIGKLEWFIKSRGGFLDCFDSIASAFIYYATISLFLT